MNDIFLRTKLLLGDEKFDKIRNLKVAIFGLGGVGGSAFEMLLRAGIGSFLIVDNDIIDVTNLNRQLLTNLNNVGLKKVDAAVLHAKEINPETKIETLDMFVVPENIQEINLENCDFIIDAIDTMTAKVALIKLAKEKGIDIISCMGTGNKLHPEMLKIADLFDTKICPVCKAMRSLLKKEKIDSLTVVYSEEKPQVAKEEFNGKKRVTTSISTVPNAAGILLASYVLNISIN